MSATVKIYCIREDSGGSLLWNAEEAYLFISVAQRGAHVSYLEYPWMIFKEYVGGVRLPDNERLSLTVIEVTSSGVERHVIDGIRPDLYTPFEGHIYANCQDGVCRWSNDHFERATADEARRLVSSSFPDVKGWSNRVFGLTSGPLDNVDGWSKRGLGGGPDGYRPEADVGGQFMLSEKDEAVNGSVCSAVSIYLQRSAQAPQRIWYLDGSPRRVSKTEYENAFGRR